MFSARLLQAFSLLNSLVSCPILSYGTFKKICGILYLLQQVSTPRDSISINHSLALLGVSRRIFSEQ